MNEWEREREKIRERERDEDKEEKAESMPAIRHGIKSTGVHRGEQRKNWAPSGTSMCWWIGPCWVIGEAFCVTLPTFHDASCSAQGKSESIATEQSTTWHFSKKSFPLRQHATWVTIVQTKIIEISPMDQETHTSDAGLVFNLPHVRRPRVSVTEELGPLQGSRFNYTWQSSVRFCRAAVSITVFMIVKCKCNRR